MSSNNSIQIKSYKKNTAAFIIGIIASIAMLCVVDFVLRFGLQHKIFPDLIRRRNNHFRIIKLDNSELIKNIVRSQDWVNYKPQNDERRNDPPIFIHEIINMNNLISDIPYSIFKKNSQARGVKKTSDGLVLFDVLYTVNNFSQRITSSFESKKTNIIIFGDSFTFGVGVNDNENFPYYLSKFRSEMNVYNLGIPGGGINDILDSLNDIPWRYENISSSGGITLYVGIFDHVERATCTFKCYQTTYRDWLPRKANYVYSEDEKRLIRLGSFKESRPIRHFLYTLLNKFYFFEYFNINIPFSVSNEQIEQYLSLVKELKRRTESQFKTKFIFTLYPGSYEYWDRLKVALEKNDIEYLDYSGSDFSTPTGNRANIPLEGHPSKISHYLFASLLNKDLSKIIESEKNVGKKEEDSN